MDPVLDSSHKIGDTLAEFRKEDDKSVTIMTDLVPDPTEADQNDVNLCSSTDEIQTSDKNIEKQRQPIASNGSELLPQHVSTQSPGTTRLEPCTDAFCAHQSSAAPKPPTENDIDHPQSEHSHHSDTDQSEDTSAASLSSTTTSLDVNGRTEDADTLRIRFTAKKLFRWVCRNCGDTNASRFTPEKLKYAKSVVEYIDAVRARRRYMELHQATGVPDQHRSASPTNTSKITTELSAKQDHSTSKDITQNTNASVCSSAVKSNQSMQSVHDDGSQSSTMTKTTNHHTNGPSTMSGTSHDENTPEPDSEQPKVPTLPPYPIESIDYNDPKNYCRQCGSCHVKMSRPDDEISSRVNEYLSLMTIVADDDEYPLTMTTAQQVYDALHTHAIPHVPHVAAAPFLDGSLTFVQQRMQSEDLMEHARPSTERQSDIKDSENETDKNSTTHQGEVHSLQSNHNAKETEDEKPAQAVGVGRGKGLSTLRMVRQDSTASDSDSDSDVEMSTDTLQHMSPNDMTSFMAALQKQWRNNCLDPVNLTFSAGFGGFAPVCALAYDERMCSHEEMSETVDRFCPEIPFPPSSQHPERPDRIRAIAAHLACLGLFQRMWRIPIRAAKKREILSVHSEDLYNMVKLSRHNPENLDLPMDTYANHSTYKAAQLSCGAVLSVTERVVKRHAACGVAIVRPPGHHAECSRSMGFCMFNNVAVAAAVAQRKWGANRIMILDWDVHHGNGTQNMFYENPNVLYVSIHRHDSGTFYPCTGRASEVGHGSGEGYNINIPWDTGDMGDAEYLAAFDQVVMPIARQFSPDLVLVSAGFDAAEGDPLGGCCVSPAGYAHMTALLKTLAGGKVVVALEGGYNLRSISQSMSSVVQVLMGDTPPPLDYKLYESSDASTVSGRIEESQPSNDLDTIDETLQNLRSTTSGMSPSTVQMPTANEPSCQPSTPARLMHKDPAIVAPATSCAWTLSRVVRIQARYWSCLRVLQTEQAKLATRHFQHFLHQRKHGSLSSALWRRPGSANKVRRRSMDISPQSSTGISPSQSVRRYQHEPSRSIPWKTQNDLSRNTENSFSMAASNPVSTTDPSSSDADQVQVQFAAMAASSPLNASSTMYSNENLHTSVHWTSTQMCNADNIVTSLETAIPETEDIDQTTPAFNEPYLPNEQVNDYSVLPPAISFNHHPSDDTFGGPTATSEHVGSPNVDLVFPDSIQSDLPVRIISSPYQSPEAHGIQHTPLTGDSFSSANPNDDFIRPVKRSRTSS